jgi:SsrA-binding protein
MKILGKNKKAFYEYDIIKKYEAGVRLFGWEVKSIRHGMFSIKEAFVVEKLGELVIINMNVSRWKTQSKDEEIETNRDRKLLLHKYEIDRIIKQIKEKGKTALPLSLYLSNHGKIKVEVGVGKGKKEYQKKRSKIEKDQKRRIEQDLSNTRDRRW